MEQVKFKTTIKCSGCVANVTPILDDVVGKDNWEVDILDPNKILTIRKDEHISDEELIAKINKLGYTAERID